MSATAEAPRFSFAPVARDNGFRLPGYWVWDPSVIRGPGGEYHMFASRWPQWLPMHPGWMVGSEIVRAVAPSPEGPYKFAEVVLSPRGAEYWDGRSVYNPTIRRHGGRYYLFYGGSTHPLPGPEPGEAFGLDDSRCLVARSRKRVGLAWADNLAGPWHRSDEPLLPTKPGTFYSFLTSNPAPCLDRPGEVAMLFKSRAWQGTSHSPMMIGLAVAPAPEGPWRVVGDEPLFGPDRLGEIEDPFLWWQDGRFQMIAKDMDGRLCGQDGGGMRASSADGRHWTPGTPPLAYRREFAWRDGALAACGSLERPFLLFEAGRPTHLCAAVAEGGHFSEATETRNVVLPLA